jgi:hypothetical protein
VTYLRITRVPVAGYPEAEIATVEVVADAVSLILDDGEQIVFLEEDLDHAIVAERQERRSAA